MKVQWTRSRISLTPFNCTIRERNVSVVVVAAPQFFFRCASPKWSQAHPSKKWLSQAQAFEMAEALQRNLISTARAIKSESDRERKNHSNHSLSELAEFCENISFRPLAAVPFSSARNFKDHHYATSLYARLAFLLSSSRIVLGIGEDREGKLNVTFSKIYFGTVEGRHCESRLSIAFDLPISNIHCNLCFVSINYHCIASSKAQHTSGSDDDDVIEISHKEVANCTVSARCWRSEGRGFTVPWALLPFPVSNYYTTYYLSTQKFLSGLASISRRDR